MGNAGSLPQLVTQTTVEVNPMTVLLNLLVAAALSAMLQLLYVRYGMSISNRRLFAGNFMLLACTTTLIITVVKSSLALSLGLVGALSIVRFRAAIKEPEELAYLFLTIAIGLGLGADQREITLIAFAAIAGLILVRGIFRKPSHHEALLLSVSTRNPSTAFLDDVVRVLRDCCTSVALRRFDEHADTLEACFAVEYDDFSQLEQSRRQLHDLNKGVQISFIDNRGVF